MDSDALMVSELPPDGVPAVRRSCGL